MSITISIDGAGRVVIPKGVRDRLGLVPGSDLSLSEADGRIVLEPARTEPTVIERDGYLVLDAGLHSKDVDHRTARANRQDELIRYATKR